MAVTQDRNDIDLSLLVRNVYDEGFEPLTKVGLKGQADEGLVCPLVSRDLSGSTDLSVAWSRILPGQHHLCHHHPDASEFCVVIEGSMLFHLGNQTFRARRGDGIYIPKYVTHGLTNDTGSVAELIVGLSKPADWQFIFDE